MLENRLSVAAVVVTYNRKNLLRECLQALLSQSRPPDEIMVIDNASSDGTPAVLAADFPQVRVQSLPKNIGGAAGFARGLEWASEKNHDWIWIMDDDLIPQANALEYLLQAVQKLNHSSKVLLGGLPQTESGQLVWGLKVGRQWITHANNLPEKVAEIEVSALSFLGLLVPARAVQEIGLPRTDFFVYFDDVEYCYRARRHGYAITCVPASKLYHPLPECRTLHLLGRPIFVERFPAWKSYYDIRNRILLALEYEPIKFWYHFLPVILLRMALSLVWYKEERLKKTQAYLLGLWDGLRRQTGRPVRPL
jgi:rhamnopyranosyl-N-acetylglucosaminyl-diphospho-decaprenol beta-1,3/1,4-galactofuranosyltransferase